MRVKEFLNYQINQEKLINNWLKENPNVEIIDIKYSVGTFQRDDANGWDAQEFSGCLILYKEEV